jgi:hypothetical protein
MTIIGLPPHCACDVSILGDFKADRGQHFFTGLSRTRLRYGGLRDWRGYNREECTVDLILATSKTDVTRHLAICCSTRVVVQYMRNRYVN